MKNLIILICIAYCASVSCMTAQEQKQMISGIAQECKATEGASDNDLSLLILKKPMTSKEGKCMFACILEQGGIMENTSWIEKGFLEFVTTALNNDEGKVKKAVAVSKKCQEQVGTGTDRCEHASKISECLKKGLKKEKIDVGF